MKRTLTQKLGLLGVLSFLSYAAAVALCMMLVGAVGMNSGIFDNPFLIWGRYRKGLSGRRCRFPSSSTTPRWTARTPAASCSGCRRASLRWKNRQPERGQEGPDDQKEVLTWKI